MTPAALLCLVVAVADGDTLTARCGDPGQYQQVKVRLAGIDAPERKQPFGTRSRQALAALCFQTEAKITQRSTDRYRRTVADVECRGQDVGVAQVTAGMAWVFDKYARDHQHLYPLQTAARGAKRGLWSQDPVPPWEWRRKKRNGE